MRTRELRPRAALGLMALIALAVAAGLAVLPAPAEAACPPANPAADTDNDGFTDAQECAPGIRLDQGTAPAATYPSCFDASGVRTNLARSECLDPDSQDLFLILNSVAASLIPPDSFEFVSKPRAENGLGIAVHQLRPDQAGTGTIDRRITSVSPQRGVRVTEKTENLASGTVLGQATNGTPNTTGRVVVFAVRIFEHVNAVRAAAGLPALLATDADVVLYIKQVIAHEMGHVLGPLANVSAKTATTYGGKHYAPADEVVMSQYVTNDGAGNLDIPDDFKAGDQTSAKLK